MFENSRPLWAIFPRKIVLLSRERELKIWLTDLPRKMVLLTRTKASNMTDLQTNSENFLSHRLEKFSSCPRQGVKNDWLAKKFQKILRSYPTLETFSLVHDKGVKMTDFKKCRKSSVPTYTRSLPLLPVKNFSSKKILRGFYRPFHHFAFTIINDHGLNHLREKSCVLKIRY